jgi:hypothetical protein
LLFGVVDVFKRVEEKGVEVLFGHEKISRLALIVLFFDNPGR